MPTTRASRTIAAPVQELWELMLDPHHLPRWWPRVTRVEDVARRCVHRGDEDQEGQDSCVLTSTCRATRPPHSLTWVQRIEGTPFASVLTSAETELRLTSAGDAATEVTIELRQQMGRHRTADKVYSSGMYMRRCRASARRSCAARPRPRSNEALDGLERISG